MWFWFAVHGRSDIDTFNMILQFKREEENLCGHRGLLPGSDQQTYTIIAPKNLRFFYEKLIHPITDKTNHNHQLLNNRNLKFDNNFEKTILTYHNINRFFAAFIDHVSAVNACTMVNCINLYSIFSGFERRRLCSKGEKCNRKIFRLRNIIER